MRATPARHSLMRVIAFSACLAVGPLGVSTRALTADDARASDAWETVGIASWAFHVAEMSEDGELSWRAAPDQLQRERKQACDSIEADENEPTTWLRVAVPDAPDDRALVQHGGAIATLERPVPADTPLRLTFRARHVDGAAHLTVHRRWGGSRPSAPVRLNDQWQSYTLVIRTEAHETEAISFNLKQTERPHFGAYERGTFLITDVRASFAEQH